MNSVDYSSGIDMANKKFYIDKATSLVKLNHNFNKIPSKASHSCILTVRLVFLEGSIYRSLVIDSPILDNIILRFLISIF